MDPYVPLISGLMAGTMDVADDELIGVYLYGSLALISIPTSRVETRHPAWIA